MSTLTINKPKNTKVHTNVRRGDVWYVDLRGGNGGTEQTGLRPCVVISNEICNRFSPALILVPISSSETKNKLPTHVTLTSENSGVERDSIALCEQPKTSDEYRFIEKLGLLDVETMRKIDEAMVVSIGLGEFIKQQIQNALEVFKNEFSCGR